eukprot:Nk52_evm32s2630 gene=Nk52_evmTU32s2630
MAFNFGGTPAASAAPAAAPAFSFTAPTPQPAASAAGGAKPAFSFGASQAPPASSTASGGLSFGQPAASSAAPGGFGGFGTPATSTAAGIGTPAPATSLGGFGSFGTPAASSAPTGFGSAAPATSSSSFGGLGGGVGFGTPAAASTSLGGFGTTPATGGLTAGATGGFGTGGFGAGSTATPGFGGLGAQGAQPAATGQMMQTNKPSPVQDLESLMTSYDIQHPLCRFKHMFYNVAAGDVSEYVKPASTDDILWNQAVLNNPDPTTLVPVQATGFQDIKERRKIQEQQIEVFESTLKQIKKSISDVSQHHKLKTVTKLEECKRKELEFGIRILRIYKKLEIFRKSGMPLSVDEENLKVTFESMLRELYKPTQYKGRLNDLLSQVRMHNLGVAGDSNSGTRATAIDVDSLSNIETYLTGQNDGLSHLMNVLKEDLGDLKIIREGMDYRLNRRM